MRVAIFVGTRADLGPLEPVIARCARQPDIDLHILCGVGLDRVILADRLRVTCDFEGEVHALAEPIGEVTASSMLEHGAQLTAGSRRLFDGLDLDVAVVLGDRWELLYVASSAVLYGIRLVHIHGGEITEGAIDDRVRHAVTKLADMHCVASIDAAERVLQMGESAERVRITGAPGLDRLVGVEAIDDRALAELLAHEVRHPLALFTYHPPTAVPDPALGQWARDALAGALAHCETVIVTSPGMDAGRDEVIAAIEAVGAADSRVVVIPSLGPDYPRVLKAVDVVVGNSSSGVIEAATAGVASVDIGARQAGRLRAASVLHADDSPQSVSAAVALALSAAFRQSVRDTVNPYGDGMAADRIVAAIRDASSLPIAKPFCTPDE